MTEANITEIFYSIQGEGPLVGLPFLFVRFGGCNLDCEYCDTDWSRREQPRCRINNITEKTVNNPINLQALEGLLEGFHYDFITFTGGEPLLWAEYIENAVDFLANKKILIETNGTLPEKVSEKLLKRVDYWSIDIKLPSVAKLDAMSIHQTFLEKVTRGKATIIKVVFSPETPRVELLSAYKLAREHFAHNPKTVLVFQPLSIGEKIALGENQEVVMMLMQESPMEIRLIPQIHKILQVL